jgi:hypothetical protein
MSNKKQRISPYQGLTREQALDTMRRFVKEGSLNHFRMGELYNYTVDSKLLQGTEFTNAVDYFTANIKEVSKSALQLYGAVAAAFREEVCSRFGITCLRLLMTYKVAAKIELNYEEPGNTFILVPDANGVVKPRLFADCGVEDLRAALANLRTAAKEGAIPAEHVALVDQYRVAVTGKFPQGTPVRVQVSSKDGKTLIDFKGIPLEQVDSLIDALMELRNLARQVPEMEQTVQMM